jgi:lipopolysaccharide export system protein LptC|tara:strand:- start:743 stop:1306 length:564 start_codon:yes stop_codon:yes gene_type:complete
VALLVISALGINWYQDSVVVHPEVIQTPKNEPDLYMINAKITQFDNMGQGHHRIRAEKFTHFPLTDITILRMPNVILYSEGESPWQIDSREGQILPGEAQGEDTVELWNEVFAKQTTPDGRFIHIRTDFLSIIPAEDYAETDRIVTIDDNNGTTTAAGMVAHFSPGRFRFFSGKNQRVNTVIQGKSE